MRYCSKWYYLCRLVSKNITSIGIINTHNVISKYKSTFTVPKAATFLQDDNKAIVVLLGTVHFSKKSVEEVSEVVEKLHPNGILVELCRQRVGILELNEEKFLEDAKNFDAEKIMKKELTPYKIDEVAAKFVWRDEHNFSFPIKLSLRKLLRMMVSVFETPSFTPSMEAVKGQSFVSGTLHAMLLKTYADIAKEMGVAPGGEFRRAYQEMKKIPGCKLFLGDRPIQITISRAFQTLTVYELGQVLYHLTKSQPKPLDKVQLEKYKDRDFIQAQFEEIIRDVPAFKKIFHVFVDERDKCLAYSIQEAVNTVSEPARILAVVGMGHVDGIIKYFGKMREEDIIPLLIQPAPSNFWDNVMTGVKLSALTAFLMLLLKMLF